LSFKQNQLPLNFSGKTLPKPSISQQSEKLFYLDMLAQSNADCFENNGGNKQLQTALTKLIPQWRLMRLVEIPWKVLADNIPS